MKKALYRCVDCATVVDKLLPMCMACGRCNGLHKAPKGTKMPKKRRGSRPRRGIGSFGSYGAFGSSELGEDFGRDFGADDMDDDDDDDGRGQEEPAEAVALGDVEIEHPSRVSFGMKGLNRVLGKNRRSKGPYGAARGSCLMLKAKPGIGKTTLAMQIAKYQARKGHKVIIATGEQSESDVRIYAEAFGELTAREKKNIFILKTQSSDDIIDAVSEHEPLLVVIDSVQMMRSSNVDGRAASEPQCHYIHHELVVGTCKPLGVITLLISQVTKDGEFRGPNTLAHLADADFIMEQEGEEGEKNQKRRMYAETKNRFGEAGVEARFLMTDRGLVGLKPKDEEIKPSRSKRKRR